MQHISNALQVIVGLRTTSLQVGVALAFDTKTRFYFDNSPITTEITITI